MQVDVRWVEGNAFAGVSESNHWLITDSSYEGGRGAAPTPMEAVLMALGGCTGIDVASILRKMRQPFSGIGMSISAERSAEHPKIFTRIEMRITVTGKQLDPEKVRRAVELSRDTYCSVGAMLAKSAEITTDVEVLEG